MAVWILSNIFSINFWYWMIVIVLSIKLGYKIWKFVYELFFMKELDLNSRYGKDSWAVITGASHGLGWGFAQGLASRGFNVLLIARNKDLLQERVQKLYEMQ